MTGVVLKLIVEERTELVNEGKKEDMVEFEEKSELHPRCLLFCVNQRLGLVVPAESLELDV